MRFLKFLEIFSEDFKYVPTKDEVRHFSRISNEFVAVQRNICKVMENSGNIYVLSINKTQKMNWINS